MPKVQGHCQLRIAGKSISLEVIAPEWVYIVAPPQSRGSASLRGHWSIVTPVSVWQTDKCLVLIAIHVWKPQWLSRSLVTLEIVFSSALSSQKSLQDFSPHRGSMNEPQAYWMWLCCPHIVLLWSLRDIWALRTSVGKWLTGVLWCPRE